MALRKILTDRDPVLHKTSRPVTNFDDRLHDLLDDLKETLANAGGAGLAAPQVGILRRCVIVVDENDEMLELASLGAKVLHNRSVEMAKKYGVQLVVRSSLNTSEGTVVKEEVKMEKMLVSGVACDKNVARIAVVGLEDQPGVAFKLFRHLANHNVNVDMILQSIGRDNTKDISFTVTGDMADIAVETVERHRSGSLKCQEVKVKKDVAKVSIVGAGMQSNPGVAARMFEALYSANVNIQQISTSEIRVTVLIDREDTDRAMNAVHNEFDF